MLRRIALCLLAVAALAAAPAAAADGLGPFAQQGGTGVLSSDGSTRFVAVPADTELNTLLEAVSTIDGTVSQWRNIIGSYGLPTLAYAAGADSLSHDGRTLVLAQTSPGTSSDFLVYDTRRLALEHWVTLRGRFTFDALSPDGSRMYLIEYTRPNNDVSHYVVRAYDLRSETLLPGRIADRTQTGWVMNGYPVTRTTSADGRWVYTLYQNGGNGYPFVHALDTVRGVAHCVGLPIGNATALYNLVLSLHGGRLAVHWRSGRPFLNVDTATWRVTTASRGFTWLWPALAAGGALLALAAAAAGALLLRRRRAGQELAEELDELLRLPEREVVV